nr:MULTISPECIES: hypothetical protein [unclassified Acinetobacter]
MKLLTVVCVGVAASFSYKAIRNSRPTLSKPDFDEVVSKVMLAGFKA